MTHVVVWIGAATAMRRAADPAEIAEVVAYPERPVPE
jgi:hypothetical protein